MRAGPCSTRRSRSGGLGGEAAFLSQLSTDMFGDQLREALEASNVDTSLCPASGQPTTLAFVKLTDGHAEYLFYDENSAGRTLDTNALPALPDAAVAVHLGAISLIPEPAGGAFEALALRESPRRVVSLDPNIRANFIPDAAGHRARIERMMAACHILKVSDEDRAWLAPETSLDDFVAARLAEGVALVIETRGADGATGHFAGGAVDRRRSGGGGGRYGRSRRHVQCGAASHARPAGTAAARSDRGDHGGGGARSAGVRGAGGGGDGFAGWG